MASLYKRPRSPFWWVKFLDESGCVRRESTGFRYGNIVDTRRAREVEAVKTLAERRTDSAASKGDWGKWVPEFLAERYRRSPKSLLRYQTAWKTVRLFLKEKDLRWPRQLTRDHCLREYFEWRKKPDKREGKYTAGHNTALLEIKFLSLVMKEAVLRGYATANPAAQLGLSREAEEKPCEFFAEDLAEIEQAIEREPEAKRTMLARSYAIARFHGVRLTETQVNPVADVAIWDEAGGPCGRITFFQKGRRGKGRRRREKPLHPRLIALFRELQKRKATEAFAVPKSFAKEWHNFFKRAGIKARLPNACFHSLRVTVQNILRRAKVPKELRMAYLSHDHGDVNDGYNRITFEEMRACHEPLNAATPREIGQRFSVSD